MWRVTIKGLLAHKLRLVLTGAGHRARSDVHRRDVRADRHPAQHVRHPVRQHLPERRLPGARRGPVRQRWHRHAQSRPRVARWPRCSAVPGVEAADGLGDRLRAVRRSATARPITTGGAPTLGVAFDPNRRSPPSGSSQGKAPTTADDVVMDLGTAQKYHFTVGQKVRILSAGPHPDLHHHRPRPLRHRQQPGRRHPGRLHVPTAQAVLGEVGQFDTINIVAEPGADKASSSGDIARCPASRNRGGHRSDRGQRANERGGPGPRLLLHGLARLRLHRSLRGRLHHLQHVLDNSWPAHAGAGLAAGRRRQPPAGVPFGTGRGGHFGSNFLSYRDRARRPGRARAGGAAERLRHLAAVRSARVRGAHGSGLPGGRCRRDRHILGRPGPQSRPYPPCGGPLRPPTRIRRFAPPPFCPGRASL